MPQNIGQKLLHLENSQPMGPVWFHQSCQQPADWHLPGAYLKNIQEIELRSSRLWNQWPELIQKCGKMGEVSLCHGNPPYRWNIFIVTVWIVRYKCGSGK